MASLLAKSLVLLTFFGSPARASTGGGEPPAGRAPAAAPQGGPRGEPGPAEEPPSRPPPEPPPDRGPEEPDRTIFPGEVDEEETLQA